MSDRHGERRQQRQFNILYCCSFFSLTAQISLLKVVDTTDLLLLMWKREWGWMGIRDVS